jgi:hypothetical protein
MSPEERGQAGSGPNQFALQWVQAVVGDRAAEVWRQMTPDYRLSLVQLWLTHNPEALSDPSAASLDRDELAQCLAAEELQHVLFRHLARVSLRELRNSFGGVDISEIAPGTRPRPVGPDLELVRLFYLPDLERDNTGNYVFAAGAIARALSILVTRTAAGWAVAGVGDGLLRPGWPPTYERIVQADD